MGTYQEGIDARRATDLKATEKRKAARQKAIEEYEAWFKATGGDAFPLSGNDEEHSTQGMTLRDYFAGQAMVGLTASAHDQCHNHAEGAPLAYKWADAMLKARGK